MQQELMQEYSDLLSQLDNLPEEIRSAKQDLTEYQIQLSASDKHIDRREAYLWEQVEGKNAELRKAHLTQLKAQDKDYRTYERDQETLNNEIAKLQDDIDYLERSYSAVCYRARLLAGLFNYLGSAGAPVKQDEVQFREHPEYGGVRLLYNSEVTSEDAEALGL